MTDEMGCDQVTELGPELALDVAAGEERDAALRHLNDCASCRRFVAELSSIGEELLLLAPDHQPDPGFDSRVLTRLTGPARAVERRPRFWPGFWPRRWMAAAAAAVVALALGAASVFLATAGDRRLAEGYRAVLDEGRGSFFAAASLERGDDRVGTVFGYQGDPSWIVLTVPPSAGGEREFRAEVVTRDGRYLPLGDVLLGGSATVWGGELPVALSNVSELRLAAPDGRTAFIATFGGADPWG